MVLDEETSERLRGSRYLMELLSQEQPLQYINLESMPKDLNAALNQAESEHERSQLLRRLKHKEILQIGIQDLSRAVTVEQTLESLSRLADRLISGALKAAELSLSEFSYGTKGAFLILGMGKLGGFELNFSSDVDLIYIYESDEHHAEEYYKKLSQKLTAILSDITSEGYVYRTDLRLRPEGRMGKIAYSLDEFKRYYRDRGRTWERLAMLKARPIAGDERLANIFQDIINPFIFDKPFDTNSFNEILDIKKRIDRKMAVKRQTARNVKLGYGGIREIELFVQTLQIANGKSYPDVISKNTLTGLNALNSRSLISDSEYTTLHDAYIFLRDLENKLQMVNDAQTHLLPTDRKDLDNIAFMMEYSKNGGGDMLKDYERVTNSVNVIFKEKMLTQKI